MTEPFFKSRNGTRKVEVGIAENDVGIGNLTTFGLVVELDVGNLNHIIELLQVDVSALEIDVEVGRPLLQGVGLRRVVVGTAFDGQTGQVHRGAVVEVAMQRAAGEIDFVLHLVALLRLWHHSKGALRTAHRSLDAVHRALQRRKVEIAHHAERQRRVEDVAYGGRQARLANRAVNLVVRQLRIDAAGSDGGRKQLTEQAALHLAGHLHVDVAFRNFGINGVVFVIDIGQADIARKLHFGEIAFLQLFQVGLGLQVQVGASFELHIQVSGHHRLGIGQIDNTFDRGVGVHLAQQVGDIAAHLNVVAARAGSYLGDLHIADAILVQIQVGIEVSIDIGQFVR